MIRWNNFKFHLQVASYTQEKHRKAETVLGGTTTKHARKVAHTKEGVKQVQYTGGSRIWSLESCWVLLIQWLYVKKSIKCLRNSENLENKVKNHGGVIRWRLTIRLLDNQLFRRCNWFFALFLHVGTVATSAN